MIVIPMAGLSQRFADAGYVRPKFMLELHGRSVFRCAVSSFDAFFADTPFLFVARDADGAPAFVEAECRALGVEAARVVVVDHATRGQAETVALGLRAAGCPPEEPVTVFNIDTFRPGFRFPSAFDVAAVDGYLEVFRGAGANWSYVRPRDPAGDVVVETAEKRPISDLCCTGLYHFRRTDAFLDAFDRQARDGDPSVPNGELYVAPLYNRLIAAGADIRYALIDRAEVIFCGTPAEYEALLRAPSAG